MAKLLLEAEKREILGRKVKDLRREGKLPANVYGKKVKSLALKLQRSDFEHVFSQSGETGIIQLQVAGEKEVRPVLATNPQRHPITDQILHIDFHQVDLKEKVTVAIPIEIEGESPAVKEKGAVLITVLDEVKVEALPQDLPEKFVVDIAGLKEFNDSLLIKDLKIDSTKLKVLADPGETIVMVQEPKEEVVEAPVVQPEAAAGEEVKGGEAPAEGAPAAEEGKETKEEKEEEAKKGE